jgi:hypothetical protein
MKIHNSVWIAALPALLACGSGFEAASDTGSEGGSDAASLDSTVTDAMSHMDVASDLGLVETSAVDTGPSDTGMADTRVTDTGIADTGPKDTGASDACAKSCSDMVCPAGEHCCSSIEIDGCALCIAGTGDICPG